MKDERLSDSEKVSQWCNPYVCDNHVTHMFLHFCHRSLLTFVAVETGTLSYELLLRYLTLCVSGNHHAEVFDVYDIMLDRFSSLETGASSLFIKSFSQTARWREALTVLHELKKVNSDSAVGKINSTNNEAEENLFTQ